MAYTVPDGAILECTIRCTVNAQTTLSVFHYKLQDSLGLPDGDSAIDAFNLEWNDTLDFVGAYAGCMAENVDLVQLVYQWIYPTRYHRVIKAPSVLNGGLVDTCNAPNVAQVITRSGDIADRHGIGTTHVPGLGTGSYADGELLAGQKVLLDTLAGFMDDKYRTDTMFPVLYNRTNPAQSRVITRAAAQSTVRVMRRRTVGVGI